MATTTPNLSLRRPEGPDTVNVDTDIAQNMTKIDNTFNNETPTTLGIGATADAGSSGRVAKADHAHGGPGFATPVSIGTANSDGVATTVSRSDHVHRGTQYLNHGPETFDINVGTTEDMIIQVPAVPLTCTLILRGRALVAGLTPAHTHTVTTGSESVTHVHPGNVYDTTALDPMTTSAGTSHNHGTSGTSSLTTAAGSSHTHSGTVNTGSNHTHSISDDGSHRHDLSADSSSAGKIQINVGSTAFNTMEYIQYAGTHGHGGVTGTEGSHTHGFSGGAEASHTHAMTLVADASHTHTVTLVDHDHAYTTNENSVGHTHSATTASTGSGGFTATSRPTSVTVTIDGTLRATITGSAGTDWNSSTDIQPYITTAVEHTIVFGCSTGGRLKAQVLMSF